MTESPVFLPADPHGEIRQVFDDIFLVTSSLKMAPLMRIPRNMVIVRTGDELTLLNPVRLTEAGERELEKLGRVRHLVRLGVFHGRDDAYCVDRFDATFWSQKGSTYYKEPRPDQLLAEGGPLPLPDAQLMEFRNAKRPECALLIQRHGGVLVTCDSVQHYGDWSGVSFVGRLVMKRFGFHLGTLVGPLWLKYMRDDDDAIADDFRRLAELDFRHLISAHGGVARDSAGEELRAAVDRVFGRV